MMNVFILTEVGFSGLPQLILGWEMTWVRIGIQDLCKAHFRYTIKLWWFLSFLLQSPGISHAPLQLPVLTGASDKLLVLETLAEFPSYEIDTSVYRPDFRSCI